MPIFLVFLKNTTDGAEFVAPVSAVDRRGALAAVAVRYPQSVYVSLTCYGEGELRRILDDAQRWPGVASTIQPPLGARADAMLRLSETRGGRIPAQTTHTPVARPPQDLKSALATLKQAGALPISGSVTHMPAPVSRQPQPAETGPAISIHPRPQPLIEKPKSVIEVFRGMRR